ncbi:MAG: FAD-dependent oxidoreductase [marine bacterium B5-7]|nr:MAG: FAD-dependent oxidoreductase [marine bacterium B5-7]
MARSPEPADIDSYYQATRNRELSGDRFESGQHFDVGIIGGGLSGLNAALELSARGYRVGIFEAHRIGWGASGRSGGQIISGFGCDITTLERHLGLSRAKTLWQLSVHALDDLKQQVARYDIHCDLAAGHMTVAHNLKVAHELSDYVDRLTQVYEYPASYLDRAALTDRIASSRYHGALLDPLSGHLHPLNYTLGVAAAAHAGGVKLFEKSAVRQIIRGKPVVLKFDSGDIKCDHVLVCANAYLEPLEADLGRHVVPVGSHIVATETLDLNVADGLIAERMAVADTRRVLDYYRLSADNRLLFGGRVGLLEPDRAQLVKVMSHRISRVFPDIKGVRIDYAWGGHVAITRTHAPHLGRLAQNIFFAQGYSGHGMVLSHLAGRILAEAVDGSVANMDLFEAIPNPARWLPRVLRRPALAIMLTWFKLLDRI